MQIFYIITDSAINYFNNTFRNYYRFKNLRFKVGFYKIEN